MTWTPTTTRNEPPAETKTTRKMSTQITRTGLEEERLIQLRKDKMALTEEIANLKNEWALAQHQYQNARRHEEILYRELQKLKDEQQRMLNQKLKVAKQQASLKPVYLVSMGGCWHASRACVGQRIVNLVYTRQSCKACAHKFFQNFSPARESQGESLAAALQIEEPYQCCGH